MISILPQKSNWTDYYAWRSVFALFKIIVDILVRFVNC